MVVTGVVPKGIVYACVIAIAFSEKRYDRYEVWRTKPVTDEEVKSLRDLGKSFQIDFWKDPTIPGRFVDIFVPPLKSDSIANALEKRNIPYTIHVNNVQDLIDDQMRQGNDKMSRSNAKELQSIMDFDYSVYHNFDQIVEWMDTVTVEYPEFASKTQFGVTYEGRPMYALKFSKPSAVTKPVIFVDSLIHSREWITAASLLFIFKEMLTNEAYAHMMDDADWYFVPIINVDGFVQTWTTDRMWRKTKTKGASSRCNGVDANRNWDSYWSVSGSSDDPCSNLYHGPTPESESAIRHLAKYVLSVGKIDAYASTHSYSQLILFPYNYANIKTKDHGILDSTGRKIRDAIYAVHGTEYEPGIGATTLYEFSGTTTDWTYDVAGVTLSYTFELRDKGQYGFVLPADQIIPTGEEYIQGLATLKNAVLSS